MQAVNFEETLDKIVAADPRYHRDAYYFVREGLDHTHERLGKSGKGSRRHVTGQELLEGLRSFGLERYGPMTLTLLAEWGVHRTADFGEIVFAMVDAGLLGKTDEDRREDFAGGYDFHDAFCRPFLPAAKSAPPPPEPKPSRV
ncbi:MAG: hypothetical protein JXQ71_02705 [Verrucomicrobia bacterium]|nr:hypothetical protein [Verrucomicrobiota bacterium]